MRRNQSVAGTSVIQCGWRCSTTRSSLERIFSGYATVTSWDLCRAGYRFTRRESGRPQVFDVAGADGLVTGRRADEQAPGVVHVDRLAPQLGVVGQRYPDGTADRRTGGAIGRRQPAG